MERINRRTDHELEGWLEAGLTTIDFQLPLSTINSQLSTLSQSAFLALPPDKQSAIQAMATPVPRKLSPREVFDAGRKSLVRFRPEQTAALLLGSTLNSQPSTGREVTVGNDHLIEFEDKAISPSPLRFLAHHFPPGDKFRAVINPMNPNMLYLFDARGRWCGQVRPWQRIPHINPDALHAQMGRAAAIEKQLLAPLAARGAELTRQRLDDTVANIAALTKDRACAKAANKILAAYPGDIAELAEPDSLSPTSSPTLSTSDDSAPMSISSPTNEEPKMDTPDDFSPEALL
jgi:hypothetical protein